MLPLEKILLYLVSTWFVIGAMAQHPDRRKIENLKKLLPSTNGIAKIDCLNALSEEYWWPPRVWPDSISMWAGIANQEALQIKYPVGIAISTMHLGVSEIYRKNFLRAEKYLRRAIQMFDSLHNDEGLGWCNLWLGQTLYSENNFAEAILFFSKSISYLTKISNSEGEGKAWTWMSFLYAATGDYDSSFEYCTKSLLVREKMSDHVCIAASLANMGYLYKSVGDYEDALDYYRQGMQYADTHGVNYYAANWNYFDEPIGTVYQLMDNPDSSLYYLQKAIQIDPANQMTRISLGETLLLKNQYDSALAIFLKPINHFRKENDEWDLMRILLDASKAFDRKKNETSALQYALEGFFIAKTANVKPYIMQGYLQLSNIYKNLQKDDSAYLFMQQYVSLKDSVNKEQFFWRLTNYKKQADFKKQLDYVTLLQKDNNIKEERLKNANLLKWALIIGLFIIAMSSIVVYGGLALRRKNEKLKSENEQALLKQTAAELEMKALRAQMNPHFIFNCLSSINHYILKNETEAASDYLTRFSRLIRMVLTNSNRTFITLEDELDMLKLYLDMERLRFKNSFDYEISTLNSIDTSNIFIPPLLLQPFAENAIWHGLMHKQGHGLLQIEFTVNNKVLICTITDNGVGRNHTDLIKSKTVKKQKSMGLTITAERLALFNKDAVEPTSFQIEDRVDCDGKTAGTRVILKLHCKNLEEASSDQKHE